MTMSREREVTRALLSITEHLVTSDDTVTLLSELAVTAVRLLDISSCGILLADERGQLQLGAVSSDAARTLELLELEHDAGPSLECFRTRRPVSVSDLDAARGKWPAFVEGATSLDIAGAHAFPLRLQDHVLGVLGLFGTTTGELTAADAEIAEALSHVAGIGLVAQRVAADRAQLAEQLQLALESRVVIEQCKGMLAAAADLDVEEAFRILRKYARDHNLGLTAVAGAVVSRALLPAVLLDHVRRR